jgi:fucose 4-O-acetylase-like acetyltransferase
MKSNQIDILKSFGILFVLLAHTQATTQSNISFFYNILGNLSVPLFFFMAGLNSNSNYKFNKFLMKLLIKVIIPYLVIGTLVYFITSLFGQLVAEVSFYEYTKFIIGIRSYLYFAFTYIAIQVSFIYVSKFPKIEFIIFGLLLFYYVLLYLNIFNGFGYLDLFLWNFYFFFGRILKIYFLKFNRFSYIIPLIILPYFFLQLKPVIFYRYWDSIILLINFNFCLIYFSIYFSKLNFKSFLIKTSSNYTFIIYLCHIPVISLLNILFGNSSISFLIPFVVFLTLPPAFYFLGKILLLLKFNSLYYSYFVIKSYE